MTGGSPESRNKVIETVLTDIRICFVIMIKGRQRARDKKAAGQCVVITEVGLA